jgi:hypothetical protein
MTQKTTICMNILQTIGFFKCFELLSAFIVDYTRTTSRSGDTPFVALEETRDVLSPATEIQEELR